MAQQNNSLEGFVLTGIKIINEIGVGAYGKVSRVEYYGSDCAAKEFSQSISRSLGVGSKGVQKMKEDVFKKFRRIVQLRHPHIVQCLGLHYKPGSPTVPLLVMEIMDCNLSTLLKDNPNLSINMKLSILLDVSLGLKFLHCQKPNVVHCNLSSNNVLLTLHLQAKISDVGVPIIVPENLLKRYMKITCFVAPEIKSTGTLAGKDIGSFVNSPVDIFSFGAIILHTFTHQLPEPKKKLNSKSHWYQSYMDNIILYDKELGSVVEDCLNDDANKRPRIEKVSEKIKRLIEKCGVIKKSVIVWQSELKQIKEERNQLESKMKQKQEEVQQLMEENDSLQKQIQDMMVQDRTEDETTLKKMVKDLKNQLELRTLEIDRLNEQISSLQQTKRSDALRDKHDSFGNKDDNDHPSAKSIVITEVHKDSEQPIQMDVQSNVMGELSGTVMNSKECESNNPKDSSKDSDVTSYASPFMKLEDIKLTYKLDESGLKVVGLWNLGNTCYFNSILQCINQTVGLHYAVAKGKRDYVVYSNKKKSLAVSVATGNSKMTGELRRVFQEVSMPKHSSFSPSSLLNALGSENSRFGRGTQEDSHEALRCLLFALRQEEIKEIEKEITNKLSNSGNIDGDAGVKLSIKNWMLEVSKGITVIDDLIGIRLVSTVVCHNCAIPLQIEDLHMDLSLPMPVYSKEEPIFANEVEEMVKSRKELNAYLNKNKYHHAYSTNEDVKGTTGLEQSLSDFTDLDILDENNKFACRNCSKPEIAELQCVSRMTLIHHLSPVLILQLKRFSIGSYSVTKDEEHVSFPQILNMTPYCTSECVKIHANKNSEILYGLYAVVVHHGSTLHSGHYTAFVRQRPVPELKKQRLSATKTYDCDAAKVGKWYCANDSIVTSVNNFTAVEQCQAYLLFYEHLPC